MSDEHILRIETSSLACLKGVETPVILPAPEIFSGAILRIFRTTRRSERLDALLLNDNTD